MNKNCVDVTKLYVKRNLKISVTVLQKKTKNRAGNLWKMEIFNYSNS